MLQVGRDLASLRWWLLKDMELGLLLPRTPSHVRMAPPPLSAGSTDRFKFKLTSDSVAERRQRSIHALRVFASRARCTRSRQHAQGTKS